jgi:hypothetical protein
VLEQVWFSGVHCDVGGGYPETGLSDITFGWMIAKAISLGLQLDLNVSARYLSLGAQYALDEIHESWSLLWLFPKSRTITAGSALANSVALRCQYADAYQPANVKLTEGVPDNGYPTVQVVSAPVFPTA